MHRLLIVTITVVALAFGVLSGAPAGTASPANEPPSARSGKVVYPGTGVEVWRASGHMKRLSATSPAFRKFVRKQLNSLWRFLDKDPKCATAPLVEVKEYRKKVAFISNEGTFANHSPMKCASGGAFRFYVKRHGRWKAPAQLGGQEYLACGTLRHWRIPRMNGALRCYEGYDEVDYRP